MGSPDTYPLRRVVCGIVPGIDALDRVGGMMRHIYISGSASHNNMHIHAHRFIGVIQCVTLMNQQSASELFAVELKSY